ncbi:MAG: sulfite exporter TauE/SafE family protein [Flavobacteriia bacterium]|nr:sulfite exporter TauE/SafE family protein [Flavobacteriia bacterium]OJX34823.1 MAG: permease [Flavobacteriia bacterium 40-80]
MEIIIGYILAFIIGIIINLLGGGGSILTVPVLVYVLKINPHEATSYSLFLVGVSSLIASVDNALKKTILYKQALIFAFPAFLVTYAMRKYVIPLLPDVLIVNDYFVLSKSTGIMLFFSIVMLLTSITSIRGRRDPGNEVPDDFNYPLIFIQGIIVGLITGFVGAGGGFLIIPAMVFLAKIPMKNAISTSLLVIAINATFGFIGDFNDSLIIDWNFLLTYVGFAIAGVLFSGIFKDKISNTLLRKSFGYLILILAILVIYMELFR